MSGAARAGVIYFAVVFAVGFVIGAFRGLVLVPHIGAFAAVLLELPVMLAAAWIACGWCLRRFAFDHRPGPRAVMGAVAFGLTMGAEVALSAMAFGVAPAVWLAGLSSAAGAAGLLGQIVFACMPMVRRTR